MQSGTESRKLQVDILRILAAFSVVVLHSAAQFWNVLPVTGIEWKIVNAYDACFRFGVPVFVMISGALFLDPARKLDVGRLYRHNILRLVVIYVLWSGIYGLFSCCLKDSGSLTWKQVLVSMAGGQIHLWYLPMLVGIYVLLPVLCSWILHAGTQNIQYFLLLFVVLQILRTTAMVLVESETFQQILALGEIQMACSYLGYFVWGYYIMHVGIPEKYHRYLYLSVLPSMALNILISNWQTARNGVADGRIYDSYGLFTFLITTAVFLFFMNRGKKRTYGRVSRAVIPEVSRATLGIYLTHVGIMDLLKLLGIHSLMVPVVGVPLLALVVFALGYMVSALLRRIPAVGRYLC